jgi:hypothetical protein
MFSVKFTCVQANHHIICIEEPPAGLSALDAARAQLGSDIRTVAPPLGFYKYEIACSLTEEQARRATNQFGKQWSTCVRVLRGAFNNCVIHTWNRLQSNPTCATLDYNIDRDTIVEAWLDAGAPNLWVPPQEEPTEAE